MGALFPPRLSSTSPSLALRGRPHLSPAAHSLLVPQSHISARLQGLSVHTFLGPATHSQAKATDLKSLPTVPSHHLVLPHNILELVGKHLCFRLSHTELDRAHVRVCGQQERARFGKILPPTI